MNLLKEKELKQTDNRKRILSEIEKLGVESTIKNICNKLSDIDKSTIYRTIKKFLQKEVLKETIIDNKVVYSLNNSDNHYIICVKCHEKYLLKNCHFDEIEKKLEQENECILLKHTYNLEGICKRCKNE